MTGMEVSRPMIMAVFVVAGVGVMDAGKKRNIPVWLSWAGWLIVAVFFWFAYGYIGGIYA